MDDYNDQVFSDSMVEIKVPIKKSGNRKTHGAKRRPVGRHTRKRSRNFRGALEGWTGRATEEVMNKVKRARNLNGIGDKLATTTARKNIAAGLLSLLVGMSTGEHSSDDMEVEDFSAKFSAIIIEGIQSFGLPQTWKLLWAVVTSIYDVVLNGVLNSADFRAFIMNGGSQEAEMETKVARTFDLKKGRSAGRAKVRLTKQEQRRMRNLGSASVKRGRNGGNQATGGFWKNTAASIGNAFIGRAANKATEFIIDEGKIAWDTIKEGPPEESLSTRRRRDAPPEDNRLLVAAILGPHLAENVDSPPTEVIDPLVDAWIEKIKRFIVESITYFGPEATLYFMMEEVKTIYKSIQEQTEG